MNHKTNVLLILLISLPSGIVAAESPLGSIENAIRLKDREQKATPSNTELEPQKVEQCWNRHAEQWPSVRNRIQDLLDSKLDCWTEEQQKDLSALSVDLNASLFGTSKKTHASHFKLMSDSYLGVQNLISACRTKVLLRSSVAADGTNPRSDYSDRLLLHMFGVSKIMI